jgi:hypothetical protein
MKIKIEPVEIKSEPEAASASSSNETTRDVKSDPEMQRLLCLNNDEIKKEPLGRTCEKCGRVTMVKNHKCDTLCKICDKKLSTKYKLIKHMQNIHRAEPDCKFFECDFCGLRLLRKGSFVKHLKLKHEGGKIDEFQCDFDGKTYTSKPRLYGHMIACHHVASKCKICGIVVKDMKQHIKLVHRVKKITVACKICNKTYKNEFLLARHLVTHNKQFECRICNRRYATAYELKIHLKIHNNLREFECKICFKGFNHPTTLRRHVITHDQNRKKNLKKSHQCEHCDYATCFKSCLKKHQKVHDENRIKSLKCPECDHTTDKKQSLRTHMQIHNPYRATFSCFQCDYKATLHAHLRKHMQTHNLDRVKDQKCPHCEKSFYDKCVLNSHVKIHNENRVMFPCSQCNHKTASKHNLKAHITRKHNKK